MSEKTKTTQLVKNSAFNMMYSILNLLFPLITIMYVSRIILPEGIGRVAYAQNITSYFITFASLGLPTYGIREIAKVRDKKKNLNKVFTELFLINIISTMIAVCVFIYMIFKSNGLEYKLLVCCGVQLLFNFINIDWFYQGIEEYVYIVCRSIALKVVSLILIVLFVRSKEDYLIYALVTSIALAGNYVFNIIHARKYIKLDLKNIELKQHIKPLIILGLAIFFSTIYSKLDVTMLGAMRTKKETGFYSNAFTVTNMVTSLCVSISAVFLPRLSYYYLKDKKKFNELINFGIQVISFFSLPMFIGLVLLAPNIVMIVYGGDFYGSISTIRILAFLVVIKGFGDLLCYQLSIATGHEKERLSAYALAAVVNVCLNALLIPIIGRNGAAIASVVSEFMLNTVQFIKMKKIVAYKIEFKYISQAVKSSFAMSICILVVINFKLNDILTLLLGFIIGVSCYVLTNYFMKNEIVYTIIGKLKKLLDKPKIN